MSNLPEHIEEKLVPYLEGVLNPKERREVELAVQSDKNLAREMSELRETILALRQGFASGLVPPPEELSVDEVIELSRHTGPVESLPGTSQQKARLFCSDSSLEEYTLLRALQEEMGRTSLDQDNVPELPAALRKEFEALKKSQPSKRRPSPQKVAQLSPAPLWRRASSFLDRIDPRPLMAAAAALVVLSMGVHLYNRNPSPLASAPGSTDLHHNLGSAPATSTPVELAAADGQPHAEATPAGVAVFTSDDRSLLKQQAEKLMVSKVRYTVTKDRILVAEADLATARDILWAEAKGKEVAMAENSPTPTRGGIKRSILDIPGGRVLEPAPTIASGSTRTDREDEEQTVTYFESGAPARDEGPFAAAPAARPTASSEGGVGASATRPTQREPQAPATRPPNRSTGSSKPTTAEPYLPPIPTAALPQRSASKGPPETPPEPTRVEASPGQGAPAQSTERRQRLKELALGRDGSLAPPEPTEPVAEESRAERAPSRAEENTDRARVASVPPVSPAPVPLTEGKKESDGSTETELATVTPRLATLEKKRQAVAQKLDVELSLEAQGERVAVYVRPRKSLTKTELEALRKSLRKELGLAETDTLIFR